MAGGFVLGAFRSGGLVAFASMPRRLLGRNRRHAELMRLHVSRSLRRSGRGRRRFLACAEKARTWDAESLFISAHSAE
ncbi:MAG: GNAT family N-acetyltransferase [Spirochaetaceae bacterium]|nr:GNAT family N-acetyltransferase [Spirochaetaceae bacterium]